MDGRKSVFFAYLFAMIGGPFGLHHLYLGRTQHALLWFTTFGGFVMGWIYELLFSISKYVREANCDHQLMLHYYIRMRQMKSPSFEITRFCGKNSESSILTRFQSFKRKFHVSDDLKFVIDLTWSKLKCLLAKH